VSCLVPGTLARIRAGTVVWAGPGDDQRVLGRAAEGDVALVLCLLPPGHHAEVLLAGPRGMLGWIILNNLNAEAVA